MPVDFSAVKVVYQTTQVKQLNQYLSKGWTLLGQADGHDESGYPLITYSYGWAGEGEPVMPTDKELYGY